MKRNKITALVLSVVMCMSLMMPTIGVLADETAAPSETQKTEGAENKEPKETEAQEPKETEKQEPKETEKQEPKETEKQEPKETEEQEPEENKESIDDDSDKTEVPTETIPPQKASSSRKNAVIASGKYDNNFTWTFDDEGTLTIIGDGQMQTSYSQGWRKYASQINQVAFSGNITRICWYAFEGCTNLTSVTIPDSVTNLGYGLFKDCTSLKSVTLSKNVDSLDATFWGCTGLTSFDIPNNIKYINTAAFAGCTNLTSVSIPNGVTYIGGSIHNSDPGSFQGCTGLKSISIPDSVTELGISAFAGCTGLTSVTIPKSVEIWQPSAFGGCTSLTDVVISEGIKTVGGFVECTSLTSIEIPSSVTRIGSFEYCTNLKSISIPDGVTIIPNNTFYGCEKLNNISLPNSITEIREGAFEGCIGLENFTIPDGVKEIGDYAFKGCKGLKSVVFPESVTSFGKEMFSSCPNLASVVINQNSLIVANQNNTFKNCPGNIEFHYYYDVIYSNDGNGTVKGKTRTFGTDVIELTITPKESYTINEITLNYSNKTILVQPDDNGVYKCTMPDSNGIVTFDASFIKGVSGYSIKVNNGSATPAKATAGTVITLTAEAAPSGKVFDKWIVNAGSVFLSNALSSITTFSMPASNVEVTATYKPVPSGYYIAKVNNGVATPSASAPGLVVNVTANDAPSGTEFEKWEVVSGTVIFADSSSATTFFVMPAENVEITAKYKSKLSVKGKTATVKYSKVKKKNQTLDVSKVLTFVDKGQGQLTYAKVSGNSKILINKTTGAITVKKKLKKKTYTVKVKVQASGDESCNPSGWKTVTFKIKVK